MDAERKEKEEDGEGSEDETHWRRKSLMTWLRTKSVHAHADLVEWESSHIYIYIDDKMVGNPNPRNIRNWILRRLCGLQKPLRFPEPSDYEAASCAVKRMGVLSCWCVHAKQLREHANVLIWCVSSDEYRRRWGQKTIKICTVALTQIHFACSAIMNHLYTFT